MHARILLVLAAVMAVGLSTSLFAAPPDKPRDEAKKLLSSKDFRDRLHALEIIEGLEPDRKLEKQLIDALEDDQDWGVQIRAAEVLAKVGGDAAKDALALHAVEGEIHWVRDAAGRALGELVPDEAGPRMLEQAKRVRDERAKARAVIAGSPFMTKDDVSRLAKYARDKDPYLARAASRALGRLYADDDARKGAQQALGRVLVTRGDHRNFLAYSGAIMGLAEANSDAARSTLVREVLAFPDDDEYVLERAARGLATFDETVASRAISAAIEADPKRVQNRRLARIAARAGLVSARPAIELLLAHKQERVRSEAVRAIGLLGDPDGLDAVRATLADSSGYVRTEAVTALARLLPLDQFLEFSMTFRKDVDMRVRLQFVVELYDRLDARGLEPLMAYLDDTTWQVASAAAATIGALGIAEDMPRLVPLLQHRDWKMRAAAYEGLGRLRAKEAIPLLAEGLGDRDPVVRGVCLTNLQILAMERKPKTTADWLAWYRENASVLSIEKRSRKSKSTEDKTKANERYARESLTRDQSVEILQKARILVVTGAWDKVERVLDHLTIPHTLLRAQELKDVGLNPNQILLVNCEGNLDGDTQERVAWFVNVGGYLMTTDWALTKTVMPVFPGYVTQFALSSTGNDVVVVEEGIPGHQLTAGVFDGVPALQWWLEIQAFPLTILYPERVDVIVDSAEMRDRYGSSPLGVAFRAGLGKIQHSASHFYLQEEGMQHASKPRERMIFAADNLGLSLETIRTMASEGAFDGRLSEETLQQIAPDYSMFRLIVNMVREKSQWVEDL